MNAGRMVYAILAVLVAVAVLAGRALALNQERPPAQISEEDARAAALAAVPGTVLDIELDEEAGRTIYEVEIRPEDGGQVVEVHVDAYTGEVVGTELEDDDDDDDEADEGDEEDGEAEEDEEEDEEADDEAAR